VSPGVHAPTKYSAIAVQYAIRCGHGPSFRVVVLLPVKSALAGCASSLMFAGPLQWPVFALGRTAVASRCTVLTGAVASGCVVALGRTAVASRCTVLTGAVTSGCVVALGRTAVASACVVALDWPVHAVAMQWSHLDPLGCWPRRHPTHTDKHTYVTLS